MMISVPHITQNNNAFRNDCGPACIAMLASAYGGKPVTVAQVVTALDNAHKFTSIPQLVTGLRQFGVQATNSRAATWEWYRETLDRGVPVIALVDYSVYSYNPTRYLYAHFLIVRGYDDQRVYVNDPLRNDGGTAIPLGEFVLSIDNPSAYVGGFNYPRQAVYPLAPLEIPVPITPFTVRLSRAANRVADSAENLDEVA